LGGPIAGRTRPTPAGGPDRSKGQNVQVSLRLSVCGTQDELGPPAGSSVGRARPAPAGGPNRSKGQNVQVSLRLSVSGTQDELGPPAGTFKFRSVCQSVELRMNLGRQPALQLGEPGRRRPVVRTAPRVRTFKFRSVCQSGEPRMNLGLQPAQAGHQDDDSRRARGVIF